MIYLADKFRNESLRIRGIRTSSNLGLFTRKVALAGILLIGFIGTSHAQNEGRKSFKELIYVEADPFAYINKGYSVHLGYENWGMRFDLTKVKVDFPEAFEEAFYNTRAFDIATNITGVKVDYIGNRDNWTKGAFVGLDMNYQKLNFSHRESLESKDLSAFNVGVRAGYKIKIYKGLYVTPWAAVWKNVSSEQSFQVSDDIISTNGIDWIATLHFGYGMKL